MNTRRRRGFSIGALAAMTAIVAVVGATWALAGGAAGPALPSPAQMTKLGSLALSYATNNGGDPHPSGAAVLSTTRKAVNELNGGTEVNTDEDVFVVKLHGHFTDYLAHVSHPAPLPNGHVMTLVFQQDDLSLTDFALGSGLPGL